VSGIATAEAHGTPQLNGQIVCSGIASGEAFGTPRVMLSGAIVDAGGIESDEHFGTPQVGVYIKPSVDPMFWASKKKYLAANRFKRTHSRIPGLKLPAKMKL
jgi:hypothetical protein